VGFAGYMTEQSFISSNDQVINVEGCVTQATFESLMEERINPDQGCAGADWLRRGCVQCEQQQTM